MSSFGRLDSDIELGDISLYLREIASAGVPRRGKRLLCLKSWSSVKDIKDVLATLLKLPVGATTRLFYRGRELRNQRSLQDCGIYQSGQTILFAVASPPDAERHALRPLGTLDPPKDLLRILSQARRGMDVGLTPTLALEGTGGTYFLPDTQKRSVAAFKPADEEPFAPNNPRGLVGGVGSSGNGAGNVGSAGDDGLSMRRGIRPGEACIREAAAYLLDHGGRGSGAAAAKGRAGVPMTTLVEAKHPAFRNVAGGGSGSRGGMKLGSFQEFVLSDGLVADVGCSRLPVDAVHRIAILDIRLLNNDRNDANILVRKRPVRERSGSTGSGSIGGSGCEQQNGRRHGRQIANGSSVGSGSSGRQGPGNSGGYEYELIPIDHGYCLPSVLEIGWCDWCWLDWPQLKVPLCPETRAYVLSLDPDADAARVARRLHLRPPCLRNFRVAGRLLRLGVEAGLLLHTIASVVVRHDLDRPSELERLVDRAAQLARAAVANDYAVPTAPAPAPAALPPMTPLPPTPRDGGRAASPTACGSREDSGDAGVSWGSPRSGRLQHGRARGYSSSSSSSGGSLLEGESVVVSDGSSGSSDSGGDCGGASGDGTGESKKDRRQRRRQRRRGFWRESMMEVDARNRDRRFEWGSEKDVRAAEAREAEAEAANTGAAAEGDEEDAEMSANIAAAAIAAAVTRGSGPAVSPLAPASRGKQKQPPVTEACCSPASAMAAIEIINGSGGISANGDSRAATSTPLGFSGPGDCCAPQGPGGTANAMRHTFAVNAATTEVPLFDRANARGYGCGSGGEAGNGSGEGGDSGASSGFSGDAACGLALTEQGKTGVPAANSAPMANPAATPPGSPGSSSSPSPPRLHGAAAAAAAAGGISYGRSAGSGCNGSSTAAASGFSGSEHDVDGAAAGSGACCQRVSLSPGGSASGAGAGRILRQHHDPHHHHHHPRESHIHRDHSHQHGPPRITRSTSYHGLRSEPLYDPDAPDAAEPVGNGNGASGSGGADGGDGSKLQAPGRRRGLMTKRRALEDKPQYDHHFFWFLEMQVLELVHREKRRQDERLLRRQQQQQGSTLPLAQRGPAATPQPPPPPPGNETAKAARPLATPPRPHRAIGRTG